MLAALRVALARVAHPVSGWVGKRIDIALAPPPANRLTRMASDFDASFVCTPVEGGTRRWVRTLNFRFRPVLRWLAEPLLRRRLAAEVREEVRLAKQYPAAGEADLKAPEHWAHPQCHGS